MTEPVILSNPKEVDEIPVTVPARSVRKGLASPYNRMLVRDIGMITLAVISIIGVLYIVVLGRTVPGELWGTISAIIGSIIGSMGRYNGHDSAYK